MIDKHFIDSFLKLNNLTVDETDETLREAFTKAAWTPEETDKALNILRGTSEEPVVSNMRTDAAFKPAMTHSSEQLSLLLGADVKIDPMSVRTIKKQKTTTSGHTSHKFVSSIGAVVFGSLFALCVGLVLMFYTSTGVFYSPV
jgi:hypothetical protein